MKISQDMKMELLQIAAEERFRARAIRTDFKVGAALLTTDGSIFRGCNVELKNALYSICAERTALVSAVAAGYQDKDIAAIAIVSDDPAPVTPCCFCRQMLMDFGPDILLIMSNDRFDDIREKTVLELTPELNA